jgi:hypothetical protein
MSTGWARLACACVERRDSARFHGLNRRRTETRRIGNGRDRQMSTATLVANRDPQPARNRAKVPLALLLGRILRITTCRGCLLVLDHRIAPSCPDDTSLELRMVPDGGLPPLIWGFGVNPGARGGRFAHADSDGAQPQPHLVVFREIRGPDATSRATPRCHSPKSGKGWDAGSSGLPTLVCGSYSPGRSSASGFLPTPPHGDAVALCVKDGW